MHSNDWLQLALFIGVLALITKPIGIYLTKVLDSQGKTWFDPLIRPFEKITYRLMGVDASKEHGWKGYTFAMLVFSAVGMLFTYAILRLQHLLPLNPQNLPALSPTPCLCKCGVRRIRKRKDGSTSFSACARAWAKPMRCCC